MVKGFAGSGEPVIRELVQGNLSPAASGAETISPDSRTKEFESFMAENESERREGVGIGATRTHNYKDA